MPFPEVVSTQRLRLVRWDAAAHTDALIAVNALPAAVLHLNDGIPYTAEETRRQSERFAAQWETRGFGLWAVEREKAVIGFVGLANPLWFPSYAAEVEIGWRIHPDAWGHGYATEAGHAALAAAPALEIDRVIAIIDPGNAPSLAVAQRLGMMPDRSVPHPQRPGSVTIYAIRVP